MVAPFANLFRIDYLPHFKQTVRKYSNKPIVNEDEQEKKNENKKQN